MTRKHRLGEWPQRLWHAVRHDIGRKLTALAFALVLWGVLETLVVDRADPELDVRIVASRAEADAERAKTDAVYLVVPDELLVRDVKPGRVTLHLKGLKSEIASLRMSAVFVFNATDLGDDDERTFERTLERAVFKNWGPEPQLTDFRIKPDSLSITLARRTQAEVTLGSLNVGTEGRPKDGYFFQESKIVVRPNQVQIAGPIAAITEMRADPKQPRLAPVNLEGRSATVVQQVELSQELLDQGVRLLTPNGMVEVTIFLVPEDVTRDLLSVPVIYLNADVLASRKQMVGSADPTLDLRVTGPPSEIGEGVVTTDELASRIRLFYDWRTASPTLTLFRPRVQVALVNLSPETVKVRMLNDDEPQIEYRLEPLHESP